MTTENIIRILNYMFAISVPFTHIGGYFACILAVFFSARAWHALRSNRLFIGLLVFIAYGFTRSAFSADPSAGYGTMTGYLSHWVLPFVLGISLPGLPDVIRVIRTYFTVFLFLIGVSVLAYFGWFYQQFGQDFYLVKMNLLQALRSHIALAAFCLLFSFVSVSLLLTREGLSLKDRVLLIVLALFFLGALILTGSRGYYLATMGAYALFSLFWFVRTRRFRMPGMLVGGFCLLAALLYLASPALQSRIRHTNARDRNVEERIALYKVALWEIKARPLFGFGPGQGIRQTEYFAFLPPDDRNVQRHPHLHSFYLNFAADFGLAGIGILFTVFYLWLRSLWMIYTRGNNGTVRALALGVFWGLTGILFGECFDTLLRGPGLAMELFWLTGLLMGQALSGENTPSKGSGG